MPRERFSGLPLNKARQNECAKGREEEFQPVHHPQCIDFGFFKCFKVNSVPMPQNCPTEHQQHLNIDEIVTHAAITSEL